MKCSHCPQLYIADYAYICLGSVVMYNINSGVKVLGNPAKEIG